MTDIGGIRSNVTQGLNQTGSVDAPNDRASGAAPGLSNQPPPVNSSNLAQSAPPIPEPRLDPATLNERYERIKEHVTPGQGADISVLMQMIQELQQKQDQEQLKTQNQEIEHNKDMIKANVEDQLKKIDEAQAKMKEQQKWGLFGKIFGGIAVALAVVAAVATGGALAIGVALVGAAVFAMQASGGMDKMFDAMGLDDKARMGIMIGISVALLIAGGAAAFSSMGSTAATTASTAAQTASTTAKTVGSAAQVASGAAQVGSGASQIGSSVVGFEIAGIQDDRQRLEAKQLQMKQMQDDLMEELKKLLDKLETGVQITSQVVESHSDSVQNQIRTLS